MVRSTDRIQKYVFPSIFALTAASFGLKLYHNHQTTLRYQNIQNLNAATLNRLDLRNELASLAQQMDQPGNDVFESHNAPLELRKFKEAQALFQAKIQELRSAVQTASTESKELTHQLDLASDHAELLIRFGDTVFQSFRLNNHALAAANMAKMDRAYGKLLKTLDGYRSLERTSLSQHIHSEVAELQSIQAKERVLILLLPLFMLALLIWGRHLSHVANRARSEIHRIFTNTADLICIASTDGTFKRVNPSFTKILNFKELELVNQPFLNFIHPDDHQATTAIVAQLAQGSPIANFENRLLCKNGGYRRISWVCEPDPQTGLLYASGRDVTVLREQENRSQQILSAIDAAAIVGTTDPSGRITHANDNFCKISGYSKEELIGKDHRILNSGAHSKAFFKELWTTVKSGKRWVGDIENKNKKGDRYFVRTVITPIHGLDGKIEEFMAIRFDMTHQKAIENQLKEAQQIAKVGSWRYDFRTDEQTWSSEHYRIFEIEEPLAAQQLYTAYRSRIHPDDLPALDRIMLRAKNLGENFTYNHRVVLDQGKRIKFVQGIGKVTKNANGEPIFISGTCQDLTEMVSLQDQIQFVLDAMDIGVWKFNPSTQELHWDRSMYTLYETHPSDFSGHYDAWEKSLSPEDRQEAVSALQAAINGIKDFNTTFQITTPTGSKKHIGAKATVLRDPHGKPTMMLGINWDRSKDVAMEQNLAAERAKASHNAKLASLGEMSAGVAHEINNPLAIIAGNVGLLNKFKSDETKFHSKILSIEKAIDRIQKIVNSLKRFSRTTETKDYANVSLKKIVDEAVVLTGAKSKRHATPVEIQIDPTLEIICDELEIEQVIVNLISNAIDAVKAQPERWVKVVASKNKTNVILQVIDSGQGISHSIEEKLFQPFFTTKPVGEGTGLGLSIAKGILDMHHATLSVNHALKNTCFEICFDQYESATKRLKNAS